MGDDRKSTLVISDTSGTPVVTYHASNGVNMTLTNARVGVGYEGGFRGEMHLGDQGSGGTLYGLAGVTANAGINYRPASVGSLTPAGSYGNTATQINAPNAAIALAQVQQITGGSYDINQASIQDVAKLAQRFPSLLNSKQRDMLLQLSAEHGTAMNGQNPTVGQVVAASREFIEMVKNAGGAANVTKLQVAQNAEQGIMLSPEQQAEVKASIEKKQAQAMEVVTAFSNLPDPTKIQQEHKLADTVTKYAPELRAGLVVAGVYVSPKLGDKAHFALGGNAQAGRIIDTYSVLANHNPDGNHQVKVKADSTSIVSLYAGIGTSPAVAMPPDQARLLGVPDAPGTNVGAYVYASQEKRGGMVPENTHGFAVQLSREIGGGKTVTGAVGVQTTPQGDKRTTAQVSLRF